MSFQICGKFLDIKDVFTDKNYCVALSLFQSLVDVAVQFFEGKLLFRNYYILGTAGN